MEFHVVTNGKLPLSAVLSIIHDIEPYVDYLHLREKSLQLSTVEKWLSAFQHSRFPLTKVIVNTHAELAADYSLGGVHLPEHMDVKQVKEKFPQLRVGSSVHSLESAQSKQQQGADYVMFGHIYETSSKQGIPPRGIEKLNALCTELPIPIISIGGIKIEHLEEIRSTGASGVAMMSGIMQASAPMDMAKKISNILKG